MPTVYRMTIRTTRSEQRGRYKVTLDAKEGTYALSVPQTVFGKLMYKVIKKKEPLILDFGRKNAINLDINLKGIRPLGKTARSSLKYIPLRTRPKKPKKEKTRKTKKESTETTATTTTTTTTTPVPKIPEITSATFAYAAKAEHEANPEQTQVANPGQTEKKPKRGGRSKNTTKTKRTKQAVAA